MCSEKSCHNDSFENDQKMDKVSELIHQFQDVKGALIPVLHQIQKLFGYLPEPALKKISEGLNISMSEIYGVATFYSNFALEPKGKHIIKVCLGTACYVKGSQEIMDKLCAELNTEIGKTTKNGQFTIEAARCLGGCGLSPVMTIDDKVYGRLVPDDVVRILKDYKE